MSSKLKNPGLPVTSWEHLEKSHLSVTKTGILFQTLHSVIYAQRGKHPHFGDNLKDSDKYVIENHEITQAHFKLESVLTKHEIEMVLTAAQKFQNKTDSSLSFEFIFSDKDLILIESSQPLKVIQENFKINPTSLLGIPCSPGLIAGECLVLTKEPSEILTQKIVVAPTMCLLKDHSLAKIKGLILEEGSLLSHASIITKELGIPCIIHVPSATRILQNGDKIRMNGKTGKIEKIEV